MEQSTTNFVKHISASSLEKLNTNILEDKALSWAAKGVLLYLLTREDDWFYSIEEIIDTSTANGADAVRSIIKQLKNSGYLVLTRVIGDRGRFLLWRHDVYDKPVKLNL